MFHSNHSVSGIINFFGCPVQYRNIHHTVDNDPAGAVAIPGADKFSRWIVTPGKDICRMESSPAGIHITG
jgi:hypothetical protein